MNVGAEVGDATGTPKVAAILVEYRSGGLTARAAQRALDLGCRVVVVDNSGTYAGPGRVILTGENIGFGAACNVGLRSLDDVVDVVVLWNPDADISGLGLQQLVAAVHNEGWAAVAPSIHGRARRDHGFAFPSPAREVWVAAREVRALLGLRRQRAGDAATGVAEFGVMESGDVEPDVVVQPGRFATAAMLVLDREALERVGGFDEAFLLYGEDLDLWDRLQRAGARCGFMPSVRATHAGSGGSEASAARRAVLRWVGVETFAAKRCGGGWLPYRAAHALAAMCLPSTSDPVVAALRREVLSLRSPTKLQSFARSALRSASDAPPQEARVGWSRTKVLVDPGGLVLDVGSGAYPNPRADVLCERDPLRRHRTAVIDRPFVVADAQALPFSDGAFVLVIASHLAEHVDDPVQLCDELRRVGASGYLETPSPLFERLLPEPNHRWVVQSAGRGRIVFRPNRWATAGRSGLRLHLYRWYYAGQRKEVEVAQGWSVVRALLARATRLFRAAMNRSGIAVTRCQFGPQTPLRAQVEGRVEDERSPGRDATYGPGTNGGGST